MLNQISQLKEVFFSSLFTERIKRYNNPIDYKYVDFTLVCTNERLNNYFNKLFRKYKIINRKHSYHDFICECIYWSYVAVMRFKIENGGSWEGLIAGTSKIDKINKGKLIKNIINTVENEIIRFVNDDLKFTTGEIDGKKNQHLMVKFEISSLDEIIIGFDETKTTKINTIDSEDNFWSAKHDYLQTFFQKWFHENKNRILVKSQLKLLESLAKVQHLKDDYTEDDCKKVLGIPRFKANQRLKDIKARVLKAWQIENPLDHKSQLQMQKENEIKLWEGLIDLIYSENFELSEQNRFISAWIIENLEEDVVSNLIYDNLTAIESRYVVIAYKDNKVQIPSKVLYKIVAHVEERLDQLQVFETKSVPFYRTKSEVGNWDKEAHQHYSNYTKKFKQQQCFTHDSKGELISIEDWKPYKESESVTKTVLPTGASIITNRMKVEQ